MRSAILLIAVAACAQRGPGRAVAPVRAACAVDARWDGAACVARSAPAALAAAQTAADDADPPAALAALDRAATEPLDLTSHVRLWELRGVVHSYLAADQPDASEHEAAAAAAFDRLLAIAPEHHMDCASGSKASLRFERTRAQLRDRAGRELEITWPRTTRLGQPVPIDVEVVADPLGVLRRLELYARPRGADAWQVADVALPRPGAPTRLFLPPIDGTADTALEVFALASDDAGNQTLAWAAPSRPREVPLRFDPPTPWYRKWWVWAIAGGAVAVGAGVTTYALTWSPSGRIGGEVQP